MLKIGKRAARGGGADSGLQAGSRTGLLPLAIVLATVLVQLIAAAALGFVAKGNHPLLSPLAIVAIGFAFVLSGIRFLAWGYLHRHVPLSHVYPLTALFFPCVLVLATLRGDSITAMQIAGTLLITAGSFLMTTVARDERRDDRAPPATS
jgi:drug/metabolite transporter (DMT)-like permease